VKLEYIYFTYMYTYCITLKVANCVRVLSSQWIVKCAI